MRLSELEMDQVVEVKIYDVTRTRWVRAKVIDPTSTPPVIEMADGTHAEVKGGRIRPVKKGER